MLVIRRREGESLLIDSVIELTVLEISPSRVKLGISAPAQVSVLRKEVVLTADENRQAACFDASQLPLAPVVLGSETP